MRNAFTFSVKRMRLPVVETACFSAEKPGHFIIIYPAFTGFPVARPSFFIFSLRLFPPLRQPRAVSRRVGTRYALFLLFHTVPHPESSGSPNEKHCTGIRPSIPGQIIPDRRRGTDGSALFRVFGRGRLFNSFSNVSNADFYGYERIFSDIRLTLFLTHDKVMQTKQQRLNSRPNQVIFP